ncbi:hypothetical protein F511_04046 [Dorcoceras hygrometricum]|uniref:RanBD1 domain-containing protein n=1 Tax=Dorcoceras hygrometricum TaxID=472368 RepID=A0A2Z7CEE9_9LAMI|nr:hypothetical protein F511_04046 [Dorcoceras hygrometricum]
MRGTKRSGIFDSTPIFSSNDSSMQSKRLIMGSQFDAQKAEPSSLQQRQPLDMKRAESSRQHVRALNSQFASWIQAQLQSHPDELWEDGVQDYLNHAKSIVEKFSDVVNWLKINGSNGESSYQSFGDAQTKPTSGIGINSDKSFLEKPGFSPTVTVGLGLKPGKLQSNDTETKPALVADKNITNLFSVKPGFPPVATARFGKSSSQLHSSDTKVKSSSEADKIDHKPGFPPVGTATFGTSWTPGSLFNNNNSSFTFGGTQVSDPANVNSVAAKVSNEEDGDDAEQPSSPSLKRSEEKGVCVVHEVKCKLYVKSIDQADKDEWRDKGMGQLSIKCKEGVTKGTKESKPTIVIRNDVGKVLLNALLYPGIKTNTQKNSVVAIFHTSADGDNSDSVVARTFLIRTKTTEDRDKLAAVIQEYAPAA